MLTIYAFAMVAVFMTLIMSGRVSAMVALIVVPIAFGLLAGFRSELGPMMLEGVRTLAPTGVMLAFAILYFGLMVDAGLFDPLVRLIVRLADGDPVRVLVGTAILAFCVSLDGDGSTTFIICVSAMLPLYKRLGLNPLMLTCILMLACGVTNITPWGGPTARAASALHLEADAIFVPMIPAMLAAFAAILGIAWLFGRMERRRLAGVAPAAMEPEAITEAALVRGNDLTERPKLILFNLALTVALIAALVVGVLPLPVLFMLASAAALVVNYPTPEAQKARIAAHAVNIFPVISVIFAAGIFTGILNGTGMTQAMAKSVAGAIPEALGPHMAAVTAMVSMPFTFLISNDAFMFGILPILAQAGADHGISSVEMARAALTSQSVHLLSPLVPSTYLLVGLAGVELGAHQRFTIGWAALVSLVLLAVSMATGVIPV